MKFWKRDSRTVEAAKKRVTRYLDEKIKLHFAALMVGGSSNPVEKVSVLHCKYIHVQHLEKDCMHVSVLF